MPLRVVRMGRGTIHIKAFTERFGFDNVRISQVQSVRQKQSNGKTLRGMFYIQSMLYLFLKTRMGELYT